MAHSITRPSNYRHPRKFSTQNFKLQEPKDFEEMISLINKTNVSRTEFENLRLKNTFTHSFSFFSKIEAEGSEQTIFDLIQEITYEYYPKRKTVFEIGDFGSKFFLILKGSAYVLIREKDLESKIKFQGKTEKNNSFVNVKDKETVNLSKETPLSQRQSIKYDKVIEKLPFLINREEELLIMKYPDLKVDKILSFGDSFGELAIRESNALRLATIVCKENCHFAVISKNTFQRALKSHFSRIMDANITFLKDHPLFSDWKNVQLEQFYRNITSINLVKRQIIYNENDEAHCFYLIKDGEIEVSKLLFQQDNKDEKFKALIAKMVSKKTNVIKRVRVSLLQAGEIFGLEEMISGKCRVYRAICVSSTAKLYLISKDKFFAYANDIKTLSKVIQIKTNVEDFRTNFLDNTLDFIQKTNNNYTKNTTKIAKFQDKITEKAEMMSQREKFDGKLHYLDVKSNSDHPKLPDSSETNNIKRENFILYEEIFFKKPKPKPKTPIYYASNKFLFAKRLRKKSKIQNNDYFNSMSEDSKGYSLINLPRTFSDNETSLSPFGHLPQNKTFKQKKTNLLKGKIGKNYIDAYFPKIDNSWNLSANQKADLSLTGNSLTISSLSCNKNIKTIQKKLI